MSTARAFFVGFVGFSAGLAWWFIQGADLITPSEVDNSHLVVAVEESPGFISALVLARTAESPVLPSEITFQPVAAETDEATRRYLAGVGAPLVEFMSKVEGSWSDLDSASCRDFTIDLEKSGSPSELADLANDIPDEPARDVVTNLIAFTVRHVGECGGESGIASEVAWHWAVAILRLSELGVTLP